MHNPKSSLWWRDSNQTASGETGAVHGTLDDEFRARWHKQVVGLALDHLDGRVEHLAELGLSTHSEPVADHSIADLGQCADGSLRVYALLIESSESKSYRP